MARRNENDAAIYDNITSSTETRQTSNDTDALSEKAHHEGEMSGSSETSDLNDYNDTTWM